MSLKINDQHFLEGENVQRIPTPKNSQKFGAGLLDTCIMHYTAGRDAKSSAMYLSDNNVKASAHIVVGRQGEVYQLLPFDTIAWHAGVSKYGSRTGYNRYSVGIEIDNAGVLEKTGNEYQAWFGKQYMENEVMKAVHRNEAVPRYWQVYTQAQIDTCEQICKLLIQKYNIKQILGHEEISVGRKQDPGPAFPLDKFRDRLLGNNRQANEVSDIAHPSEGAVTVDKLNIRAGAGTQFDKIAMPLINGKQVRILEEQNGWYRVRTEIEGWVSKGYIETTE
ncbi:MAG: N-acetylmuramoyl-L-alanine amidase [Cytophagales bacterium]|nr:N-acetylmuramoyl-L-alanine amidase [Cytophaga sp.]